VPGLGSTSDEGFEQWKQKRLAKPAERRFWFEIKRLANDILIVFVEDEPQAEVGRQAGAVAFRSREFPRQSATATVPGWLWETKG
jgi:hypothetical protein